MRKETAPTTKPSKIHWHDIKKFGYPEPGLRKLEAGIDRVFLVKTDDGLKTSWMLEDGSGFSELGGSAPIEWAYY